MISSVFFSYISENNEKKNKMQMEVSIFCSGWLDVGQSAAREKINARERLNIYRWTIYMGELLTTDYRILHNGRQIGRSGAMRNENILWLLETLY